MTIRNKLLILLLSVSLIPLVAYFTLDISFSRIVRNRIQRTLRFAVEERARDTLVQTVKNYEEKLNLSRQAVRFGIRHYADQVQQNLWSINVGRDRSASRRPLIKPLSEDISTDSNQKYKFVDLAGPDVQSIDFESQFVISGRSESQNSQQLKSAQLTRTCRNIYQIHGFIIRKR